MRPCLYLLVMIKSTLVQDVVFGKRQPSIVGHTPNRGAPTTLLFWVEKPGRPRATMATLALGHGREPGLETNLWQAPSTQALHLQWRPFAEIRATLVSRVDTPLPEYGRGGPLAVSLLTAKSS